MLFNTTYDGCAYKTNSSLTSSENVNNTTVSFYSMCLAVLPIANIENDTNRIQRTTNKTTKRRRHTRRNARTTDKWCISSHEQWPTLSVMVLLNCGNVAWICQTILWQCNIHINEQYKTRFHLRCRVKLYRSISSGTYQTRRLRWSECDRRPDVWHCTIIGNVLKTPFISQAHRSNSDEKKLINSKY